MARKNFCDDHSHLMKVLEEIVFETVTFFRQRGHSGAASIEQASLALNLTKRRVWAVYYQQPFATAREEIAKVKQAYVNHLDHQASDLARRSELARLRRQQIELDL